MATDDRQVLVVGQASAPASFTVPGNGQITPRAIYAHFDGTSAAGTFTPAVKVISDAGKLVGIYPTCNPVAAGGSAEASWFPGVKCCPAAGVTPGVALETLFVDSTVGTITSSTVLTAGHQYLVSVQGTYSVYNAALNQGTPEADAMFPTAGGRVSTQVGQDAETCFARIVGGGGPPLGHQTQFLINTGAGNVHVEPQGGPYATPVAGHLYSYTITGAGNTVTFVINDTPLNDNYGKLRIIIQDPTSSGGSGTLVPAGGTDHAILRSESGVPTWEARPDVVEADLSLTNITTADVTTSRHGFAPKAPNDATKFLDGTGAYSVPAGGSPLTTKGDLFGHSTVDARIPIGADTFVLTADSAQALGLKWAAAASGGVTSFAESGQAALTGAVTISPGAGVTMTQAGQNVAIASTASGSGSTDGWLDDTAETWTFATFAAGPPAIGTFTISGDVHTKYTAGTRIKMTQTTVKYFVVTIDSTFGGGNTTVTISGGTDFTLANAAISANYHSYSVNPQGYPGYFTFAPGITGYTGAVTITTAKFGVIGRACTIIFNFTGTSNATTLTATAPITAVSNAVCPTVATNAGTVGVDPGRLIVSGGTTTLGFSPIHAWQASGGWTNSGVKAVTFCTLIYDI